MRHFILATLLLALIRPNTARADDWPQWLGPRRDGVWREAGLLTAFPKDGPPIRWRVPIGAGYSGPAVAGGRLFVTDRIATSGTKRPRNAFDRVTQPGSERVVCMDVATGMILWIHEYDAPYSMSYAAGPRATPAVDGDRVYTLGAEGDLLCLNVETGKPLWSKKLSGSGSPTPMWGYASHPLVEGDALICLTGASPADQNRGVVTAFDKLTGKVLWTALTAKEPGYAPPMVIESGRVRQLIVWDPVAVTSLDPRTGKTNWSLPFGPARMGMTIATPRFIHDDRLGDVLFVASQYEGSTLIKLDGHGAGASVLWKRVGKSDRKSDALHVVACPPVLRAGHVYGIDTYGALRCLDLNNGDRLWSTYAATTYDAGEQKWSQGFLIPLGDSGSRFLIANEHGDLILADLDPAGYHEISRTHLLDPTNTDPGRPVLWSHPALADECIFWRNDKELICASMAAPH